MKQLCIIFITCFLLSFVVQKKNHVIFFGDSITQAGAGAGGYITMIDSLCAKEKKSDRYTFTGAGIGGNKIYDLYLRMNSDVLAKQPDVVVIYIGVNDVWHKTLSGTGSDADKFEKFYQAIIDTLLKNKITTILCTPAAIGERTDFTNQLDGDLNRFSSIIRALAEKNKLPLVDLRQHFLEYNKKHNTENKESGVLTTDRVHLNRAGNQLVAEQLWHAIKSL